MERPRPQLDATVAEGEAGEGFHLLGVVRNGGHALPVGWRWGSSRDTRTIAHRDLAALVRAVPFRLPNVTRAAVQAHQDELDRAMRRGAVAPAPFGIVFRDRTSVEQLLDAQYTLLEETLDLVENRWEFRLHVRAEDPHWQPPTGRDLPAQIYAELRSAAAAATPLPHSAANLFSAAYLVDRGATPGFLERVEELGRAHRALLLDVTGPWPPYDFVLIRV
jgi:hypothetical protein